MRKLILIFIFLIFYQTNSFGAGAVTICDPHMGESGDTTKCAGVINGVLQTLGNGGGVSSTSSSITGSTSGNPLEVLSDHSLPITVANSVTTSTISSSGGYFSMAMQGKNSAAMSLSGTWAGTVRPQVSYDNGNTWSTVHLFDTRLLAGAATSTTNGQWAIVPVGGATNVRALVEWLFSGSVIINLTASTANPPVVINFPIGSLP